MSQGHTIPLLYLTRLLLRRSTTVTIVTTSANSPLIRAHLDDTNVSIIELPFPQNIHGLPPGVENTHKLPSMSFLLPFLKSTKLLQKPFEQALESLQPPVSAIISDGFLGWTLQSAKKINVPRFVFFGMNNFSTTVHHIFATEKPHLDTKSVDDQFSIPGFPHLILTRNDFDPPFSEIEPSGEYVEFMMEQIGAMIVSNGIIVNSFYELESVYVDFWNSKVGPKAYSVGPLCVAAPPPRHLETLEKSGYIQYLNRKQELGEPVLYVAFGTQAEVSPSQLEEIAIGLEKSGVSFIWALRSDGLEFLEGFESRTKERGMVVKDWLDQLSVLRHGGVKGFLSHCGWNSVMESISARVPIVAMPFMAEQHLNARFVAEEVGIGLRVMPKGGSVRGMVEAAEVERVVRELMLGGEKSAEVRRKMAEYGAAAEKAMGDGGSSWRTLDGLIEEIGAKFK